MQKRRTATAGFAAMALLLGAAGAVAAADPFTGPPQSPPATDAPDKPGVPDTPEPGDTPDAPTPAP